MAMSADTIIYNYLFRRRRLMSRVVCLYIVSGLQIIISLIHTKVRVSHSSPPINQAHLHSLLWPILAYVSFARMLCLVSVRVSHSSPRNQPHLHTLPWPTMALCKAMQHRHAEQRKIKRIQCKSVNYKYEVVYKCYNRRQNA